MDFEWVAIAMGDVTWISLAFLLGFAARMIGLPPLIGFLVAGFVLDALGAVSGDMLKKLSDLGITLLLFTIGLKLNLNTLRRPQVWAVTSLHMLLTVVLFGALIFVLSLAGISQFAGLTLETALVVAFALSFSSTVFVVKVLEERGELASLHGSIAIGILIMQDLIAVVFLAASAGKLPSVWAPLLFGLILVRPLLGRLLALAGHGELLILYGFFLALGGAELFELVGVKADLGALLLGVLVSNHSKAGELAKEMLGFKDLFLVGFFLSVGLAGHPTLEIVIVAAFLTLLVICKSALFFLLLTRFNLRARTSLLTTLNLTNYSEFGLIVAAIAVTEGWIANSWLVTIAVTLSLSFIVASPLNYRANELYSRYRSFWKRHQRGTRLADDRVVDTGNARVVIFGMGRVGTGAYDRLQANHERRVIGVDFNATLVVKHRSIGREVIQGDPTDADFWDRLAARGRVELVMLALPKLSANLRAVEHVRSSDFSGRVVATARYPDEIEVLRQAGVDKVFNIYAEAGLGFADHVSELLLDAPETPAT